MNTLKRFSFLLLIPAYFLSTTQAHAQTSFKGSNYSGHYLCKGNNQNVGDYEVAVQLKLNKRNSHGNMGVYDLVTETENKDEYLGQAVTTGTTLAVTFKLSTANHVEFSTGLGQVKKIGSGRWAFSHQYYEPDDTGGNYGQESCVMQAAPTKTKIVKSSNSKHTK